MLTATYARSRAMAVGHVCIYLAEALFSASHVSGKQKSVDYFFLSCLFTFFHCPTGLAAYIHYCSLYLLFLTLISVQSTSFTKNIITFYDSLDCPFGKLLLSTPLVRYISAYTFYFQLQYISHNIKSSCHQR